MRRALVPLIASVAVLGGASPAAANEWCIAPASGCANGNVATVQGALDLAKSNAGPDQIRLGGATYSGPFTYDDNGSATNSVAIRGFNSRATTITRPSSGRVLSLAGTGGARNSISDLRIHITSSSSTGLQGSADVSRVAVAADPSVPDSVGMNVIPGSVHNTRIGMPLSGFNTGLDVGGSGPGGGVFDSTITADVGVGSLRAAIEHCNITAHQTAITESVDGTIDDVLVRLSG